MGGLALHAAPVNNGGGLGLAGQILPGFVQFLGIAAKQMGLGQQSDHGMVLLALDDRQLFAV